MHLIVEIQITKLLTYNIFGAYLALVVS